MFDSAVLFFMLRIWQKIKKLFLEVIYPINCLGCGHEGTWLCKDCEKKLPRDSGYMSLIDFSPSYLEAIIMASDWQNVVLQKTIHAYKYNFAQELSLVLAKLLIIKINLLAEVYPAIKDFILVGVPLHRKRRAWRGFNQAELLAELVGQELKMTASSNLIKRIKNTKPQVKLNSWGREKNIKGAFKVNLKDLEMIKDRNIILIDDVMTTGATMNECARVLKEAGVKIIWGLAVARG
mgnify:CR=1 FL=1